MEPLDYCRQKVAGEGSSLHYLLLFQPPARAATLLALHALEAELCEVIEACSQLQVARQKLGFWAEEIQRMLAGTPRHPVCLALAKSPGASEVLPAELCRRLMHGVSERLQAGAPDHRRQLQSQCLETAGVIGLACGRALDPRQPAAAEALQQLAAALEQLRLLRFPSLAGLPLHYTLPAEELTRFRIPPADFKAGADSPQLRALKQYLLACTRQAIAEARQLIQPGASAGFAEARARMALAECDHARAWLRSGINPGQVPSISPLRKLWIAWNSAKIRYPHQQRPRNAHD